MILGKLKSSIINTLYKVLAKPIFFILDPEFVHDRITSVGNLLGSFPLTRYITKILFSFEDKTLQQEILGINFKNPIGLAAGFDKNAELTQIMGEVGFGFEEFGSVTGEYCPGNKGKRLWRLKKSLGLVVYYGLKNNGALNIFSKLKKIYERFDPQIPLGSSVAMTNNEANMQIDRAIEDYCKSFRTFSKASFVSYITINISCPNTCGGQPFINALNLDKLLSKIDSIETVKPIFLKLSPDMQDSNLDELINVADKHRVHGLICTNLTKKRDNKFILENKIPDKGGISGKPVQELSDNMIKYIYKKKGKRFVIIGCGVCSRLQPGRQIRRPVGARESRRGWRFLDGGKPRHPKRVPSR